jgi:hypothetical protein
MSHVVNPNIPLDGLIYYIDPSNRRCFSGSGVHINNLVTSGFGGTLFNGTTTDADLRKSFIFDGSNDYITVPLPAPLSTGSSLSISLWAKWLTVVSVATTAAWCEQNLLSFLTQYPFCAASIIIGHIIYQEHVHKDASV